MKYALKLKTNFISFNKIIWHKYIQQWCSLSLDTPLTYFILFPYKSYGFFYILFLPSVPMIYDLFVVTHWTRVEGWFACMCGRQVFISEISIINCFILIVILFLSMI